MELSPRLKSMMDAATCQVHHKHPIITTAKDDKLKIECCCADFEVQRFQMCKKAIERPVMYLVT